MRKLIDDPRLMVKVCDLYYNQNISQQQIADILELSRPTVAKLLVAARTRGVVQISISDMDAIEYWELERQLEKKYGLREVVVVSSGKNETDLEEALGRAGAKYLQYMIKDGDVIGVSMGTTLFHVAPHLHRGDAKDVTFVPLVGGMGRLRMELHSNSLVESMSRVYGGNFLPLHAPARVSNAAIRNEFMKEESLRPVIKLAGHMDVALVGIGYPNEHSAIKATGYYKENEIEALIEKKVVGELCMQFYNISGDTAPYRNNNTVIGVDIRKLRKVPCSIGLAGGVKKIPAIRGAIHGGYINTLITDADCAAALVSE